MQKHSYSVCNYLDDLAGAEFTHKANSAFLSLQNLLRSLNLIENLDKATPPAVEMEFLGILLNSESFTMTIPSRKLRDIRDELNIWINKEICTLKNLQSLIGKLQHLSCCIRGGRIFVNRLLNSLREATASNTPFCIHISREFKQDLYFWLNLMQDFNGVSIMSELVWSEAETVFSCDSSLFGSGGINFINGTYFHFNYQKPFSDYPIHLLEMLTLIACCKIWGKYFKGSNILCRSDNLCTVIAVNDGKSKDTLMQACIRELFYVCTLYSFDIKVNYIASKDNTLADLLSRFPRLEAQQNFASLTKNMQLEQVSASNVLL